MADSITFASRSGSVIFDFEQNKIIFDRGGGLADTIGLMNMEVNMNEVTDIELRQPSFTKLGGFNLIINGIRYVTKSGFDATQFAIPKKAEFPALEDALRRVAFVAQVQYFSHDGEVNAPKQVYEGPQDPGLMFSFENNTGSSIRVYENYVVLKHSGLLNTLSMSGAKGEKRINCNSISAVECRKATTMAAGFIQFSIFGSERAGGVTSAAGDENSILFDAGKNNLAQQIVDYIEQRRIAIATPQAATVVQGPSAADELLKFKQLLDMGVITQEEFDAKKKQLLGL